MSKKRKQEYHQTSINNEVFYTHRLIWEAANGAIPDDMVIDHIDRDKRNNTLSNLRLVTRTDNQVNSNKSWGKWMRGVTMVNGIYKSQIQVKGKTINIGRFKCETAAHLAYLKARNEYYPGICV